MAHQSQETEAPNQGGTAGAKGTWLVFMFCLLNAFPCLHAHIPQTYSTGAEKEGVLYKKKKNRMTRALCHDVDLSLIFSAT